MLTNDQYIILSIENNLFWVRIMKEHSIFIESSLPMGHRQLAAEAGQFRREFDRLFETAVILANDSVSPDALHSGQYYTRYTEAAEQTTRRLTGIPINSNLTKMEYNIQPLGPYPVQPKMQEVGAFNQYALNLVGAFAQFKADLYNSQASCRLFTFLYTSVYEHILREAQKYMEILTGLQNRDENYNADFESFWNRQLSDHAKVMRGLFDPAETEHFNEADRLAKMMDDIIKSGSHDRMKESEAAIALSEFKSNTKREILECKVKSLMSPLFTDHILREANCYIYLLQG